jgi:hypothetical protein
MDISKAAEGTFERGDNGRFTGDVWLRGTVTTDDGTNVGVVYFSPGASGPTVNGGGAPEWGDPVTDEEFGEGF